MKQNAVRMTNAAMEGKERRMYKKKKKLKKKLKKERCEEVKRVKQRDILSFDSSSISPALAFAGVMECLSID